MHGLCALRTRPASRVDSLAARLKLNPELAAQSVKPAEQRRPPLRGLAQDGPPRGEAGSSHCDLSLELLERLKWAMAHEGRLGDWSAMGW